MKSALEEPNIINVVVCVDTCPFCIFKWWLVYVSVIISILISKIIYSTVPASRKACKLVPDIKWKIAFSFPQDDVIRVMDGTMIFICKMIQLS